LREPNKGREERGRMGEEGRGGKEQGDAPKNWGDRRPYVIFVTILQGYC